MFRSDKGPSRQEILWRTLRAKQLQGVFRGIERAGRKFGMFQVEISTYSPRESPIHPRAAFPEQWIFRKMSGEVFQKISRHFRLAQWVSFAGWGEPLEHEDFLPMLRSAKEAHCLTSLTTDGFNLNEPLSQQLLQDGIDVIVVSLALEDANKVDRLAEQESFAVLQQVGKLAELKKKLRRDKPFVKLSVPMTRLNILGLPRLVPLAARLGVEEVVFPHLDYLPDERWNILRAFYHESRTPAFEETAAEIRRMGREMGVGVKVYPFKAEEVPVCEPDPPRNVVFAADGSVAPCPFLRLPKKGDIPRIFMNKPVRVPQVSFGNAAEEDFTRIWDQEPYREFRKIFEERKKASLEEIATSPPLSDVCRTCYKAYGI